jgi:hypothetical protein
MSKLTPIHVQAQTEWTRYLTRRHFLKNCQIGLGAVALSQTVGKSSSNAAETSGRKPDGPLAVRPPNHPTKTKRVIYLHMSGSPPQQDLFDWKPTLVKHHMEPCPDEILKGERFAFIKEVCPPWAIRAMDQ